MLRNLRPPVSVYFDKERLDSLDEKAEVFLTMLASFAQEESRSISTNIKWATRSRMKAGTQKISTTSLLGYDTDDDGEMVIVTNEAEIVRTIYMLLSIWDSYKQKLNESGNDPAKIEMVERFAFYERAHHAYAIIATGESAIYALEKSRPLAESIARSHVNLPT